VSSAIQHDRAPGAPVPATGPGPADDTADRHLGALLLVLLAGLSLGASAVAIDAYLRDGGLRMFSAGAFLGSLGIFLAVAAAIWTREPPAWKHRFVPQRYNDGLFMRIAAAFGSDPPPLSPMIPPERILAATWVREALAERLVMGLRLGPMELSTALDRPRQSHALDDRPALRRFLDETRDLGVAQRGTVLTLSRKEFLKAAEEALGEADTL